MMVDKALFRISKYRLGDKSRYQGLVIHHEAREYLDFTKVSQLSASEGTKKRDKTPDWDLLLMIEDLKAHWVSPYLAWLNLPSDFSSSEWTRKKSKDRSRDKPAISAFERFKRFVFWRARKLKISGHQTAGVRLALKGLNELLQAESKAKSGHFEKAAVHMGRVAPIIAMLQIWDMEHQWHNGQSYQAINKSKANKDRKPALKAIYVKLAKRKLAGTQPKELWPLFIQELHNATADNGTKFFDDVEENMPNMGNIKSWYVKFSSIDSAGNEERSEKVSYETFNRSVNREYKKIKG